MSKSALWFNFVSNKGISRAEAMLRALAKMLEEQKRVSRESAFGAWQKRDVDSRKFVDQLRDEWEKY